MLWFSTAQILYGRSGIDFIDFGEISKSATRLTSSFSRLHWLMVEADMLWVSTAQIVYGRSGIDFIDFGEIEKSANRLTSGFLRLH